MCHCGERDLKELEENRVLQRAPKIGFTWVHHTKGKCFIPYESELVILENDWYSQPVS